VATVAALIRIFCRRLSIRHAQNSIRAVPVDAGTRPEWLHEIKYDGYRLIAARDGARVRLFTAMGTIGRTDKLRA
jgi:ATP-dependent DNA ligase